MFQLRSTQSRTSSIHHSQVRNKSYKFRDNLIDGMTKLKK